MISAFDRFIMTLVNAQDIICICANDVKVADDLLESINLFEAGLMTPDKMKIDLHSYYDRFRQNSIEFIKPVD